eukprot:6189433-Pleurochrysis_carterae.AAC.2
MHNVTRAHTHGGSHARACACSLCMRASSQGGEMPRTCALRKQEWACGFCTGGTALRCTWSKSSKQWKSHGASSTASHVLQQLASNIIFSSVQFRVIKLGKRQNRKHDKSANRLTVLETGAEPEVYSESKLSPYAANRFDAAASRACSSCRTKRLHQPPHRTHALAGVKSCSCGSSLKSAWFHGAYTV